MTFDNKKSNSQHTSLDSFFPLLYEKESTSKEETSVTTTSTILIQRRSPNSDIWICNSCTWTGDIWFMENHPCRHNVNNNFAKIAQRLKQQKEL
jgi:hypothetical protein